MFHVQLGRKPNNLNPAAVQARDSGFSAADGASEKMLIKCCSRFFQHQGGAIDKTLEEISNRGWEMSWFRHQSRA